MESDVYWSNAGEMIFNATLGQTPLDNSWASGRLSKKHGPLLDRSLLLSKLCIPLD